MKIPDRALIKVLKAAAFSRKSANLYEQAVNLAMFAQAGNASKQTKSLIYSIYAGAGYDCLEEAGKDYKTCNRRINIGAALYDTMGHNMIVELIGEKTPIQAIEDIKKALEAEGLSTIEDMRVYTGSEPVERSDKPPKAKVLDFNRRATDKDQGKFLHVVTDSCRLDFPFDTDPKELYEIASKILHLANELKVSTQKAA